MAPAVLLILLHRWSTGAKNQNHFLLVCLNCQNIELNECQVVSWRQYFIEGKRIRWSLGSCFTALPRNGKSSSLASWPSCGRVGNASWSQAQTSPHRIFFYKLVTIWVLRTISILNSRWNPSWRVKEVFPLNKQAVPAVPQFLCMYLLMFFSGKHHSSIIQVCSHLGEAGFLKSPVWIGLEIPNLSKVC